MEKSGLRVALQVISIIMLILGVVVVVAGAMIVVNYGITIIAESSVTSSTNSDFMTVGVLLTVVGAVVIVAGVFCIVTGAFGLSALKRPKAAGAFLIFSIIDLAAIVLTYIGMLVTGSASAFMLGFGLLALPLPIICVIVGFKLRKELRQTEVQSESLSEW